MTRGPKIFGTQMTRVRLKKPKEEKKPRKKRIRNKLVKDFLVDLRRKSKANQNFSEQCLVEQSSGFGTQILCIQCDQELSPLKKPRLYCSIACEQEAELVRYVRRCTFDGRLLREDVQFAISTRLAHIASGGYDKKARKLTVERRTEVISKSNGFCVVCGKPGVEIDHVAGSSSDIDNLQLLCRRCHELKTNASLRIIMPDSENWEQVNSLHDRFYASVHAPTPLRPCHDETTWATQWRGYLKERAFFVLP
jgi:HNH endonuclease